MVALVGIGVAEQEAARIVDGDYTVNPLANWCFMMVSTPLITVMGWFVTERIVARRFDERPTSVAYEAADPQAQRLTALEVRGLWYAIAAIVALSVVMCGA